MSFLPKTFLGLLVALFPLSTMHAEGTAELFNPDFEQDTDNVGYPDGWKTGKEVEITLTREGTSSGTRALVISSGYAAVFQDLEITGLAGRRVVLQVDARSPDGAALGVRVGYYVLDEVGGKKWVDGAMIWNKELDAEYQTLSAHRIIPENALDGRFWICLYRSKSEGTVVVDNIRLDFLSDSAALDTRQSVVLQREHGYFLDKLRKATAQKPGEAEWVALEKEANALRDQTLRAGNAEEAFEKSLAAFRELNARLQKTLYGGHPIVARWVDGYERLEPTALPETGAAGRATLHSLSGEHAALGVELANPSLTAQTYQIRLEGPVAAAVEPALRRHVLVETWYTKGATLIADPLTLLPREGGQWKITLQPGEVTRLHVSLKQQPRKDASELEGTLTVQNGEARQVLPFLLKASPHSLPRKPQLAHYQFLYTQLNVVNRFTEEAREDLASHGVSDIEWPFKPSATFTPEGDLVNVSLGATPQCAHTRWLNGFKDSDIRFNLFWMKDLKMADGKELERYSAPWLRAWQQLVTAYLDYAETLGIPRSRFTILPMDEIHSKRYENSPDENIATFNKLSEATREGEPQLPRYLTIGNYAFPADVEAFTPHIDVAISHWPRPLKLSRNAPADYPAREDYFAKSHPILQSAVKNNGLKYWTYRVQSGRSDAILAFSRAYPLLAVAHGYTGFGYWAYNVSSGSTWNDTDGKILDYCLVYDGGEEHPLNQKYNVTGESIVPSIRWEAIRAAYQDGQILLHLLDRARGDSCPPALRKEIETLQQRLLAIGGEHGYGGPQLTAEAVQEISGELRECYVRSVNH